MFRILVLFLFIFVFLGVGFELGSQILIDKTHQKVHGLYYSTDDRIFAATTSNSVNLYNAKKRNKVSEIHLSGIPKRVTFEVKKNWIAVLMSTNTIHVWDIRDKNKVFTIQAKQVAREVADI